MPVLNYEDIEKRCKENNMIVPYNPNNIKYSSYDLSVGDEYKLTSSEKVFGAYERVEIPPYEVCLILAKEQINLPNDVCAFLFSRNRAAREGFLMHPQAPIEPGSRGGIYILLHNISNKPIYLYKGEHLATIVFQQVTQCHQGYGSNQADDKYIDKTALIDLVGKNTYTPALKEVNDSVTNWKVSLISKLIPALFVAITIMLGILTLLVTVLTALISRNYIWPTNLTNI